MVVAVPLNVTLHAQNTVGPAAFLYTDGDTYVAIQDGARTASLHAATDTLNEHVATGAPFGDLTQYIYSAYAQVGQNLDAGPLSANVNALLGLGATDTYSPFLIVFLIMSALSAFAAVRCFARSPTLTAALAGCLFGGAMFLELWFDTYQAAIIAMGLVLTFVVLVDQALRNERWASLVLVSLVAGTMLTVYPIYLIPVGLIGILMVAWHAWALHRSGGELRPWLRRAGIGVAAVLAMAAVFDPIGLLREIHFYPLLLDGKIVTPRVGYTLPPRVLPGWLTQTREFYALTGPGTGGLKEVLLGGLLPLLFLGIIVVGLLRYRQALTWVALSVVLSALALYAYLSEQSCTYCAERLILPLGPIVAVLITLGIAALLVVPSRWSKAAGILGLIVVVVAVAERERIEMRRFKQGAYFLDTANREVLSRLPAARGAVLVEGYGASTAAQAEQPLVYDLVEERAPGRASIILGSEVDGAITYLDFDRLQLPPGAEFKPNYRYVLTRLAGVGTDRRLISRRGGIALEERVKPLDITPFAGLGVPLERIDSSGVAWVQPQYPLQFYIAGYSPGTAWARLTFRASVPVSVPPQPGVRTLQRRDDLTVCVRAVGRPPVRAVTLALHAAVQPGTPPPGDYPPAMPLEGLALTSMHALAGSCRP